MLPIMALSLTFACFTLTYHSESYNLNLVLRLHVFAEQQAAFIRPELWMDAPCLSGSLVVVQLLSCVQLFVTSWAAARQASLSLNILQSLLKLMSIESVMPSNHLILCRPHDTAWYLVPTWFCRFGDHVKYCLCTCRDQHRVHYTQIWMHRLSDA